MRTMYCDNCGNEHVEQEMHHYSQLPWPVASACMGESGSVCDVCYKALSDERALYVKAAKALKGQLTEAEFAKLCILTSPEADEGTFLCIMAEFRESTG